MRRVLRLRSGQGPVAPRRRRPIRRGPAGAVLLAVPVVPGAQVARPRNLRHPVVHDHAPGDAGVRHGTQPVVRTEPGVQRLVHGRFRAAVGQRGAVRVRQDRAVADQRPDDVPRTETVRRGQAPTVVGIHQHAFHHRIAATVPGQHDPDRRHPPATSRSVAIREYLCNLYVNRVS